MDIIIGREAQTDDLQVVAARQTFTLGRPGSVPRSVSRQHCRLSIDAKLCMTIANVKPENVTHVDGVAIMQKRITADSVVTLGRDDYRLPLRDVLDLVPGLPRHYAIGHLRPVWSEYYDTRRAIQHRERMNGLYKSAVGIIPMVAIGTSFIPAIPGNVRTVLYVVAIALTAYFLVKAFRSKATDEFESLDNALHERYRCPNPDCHRFLGYTKYDELLSNGTCPYCHAHFGE